MKVITQGPLRYFFFTLGFLSLVLAVAGVILPVLPAAPFVISAAYFFSKSSKKFHDGLRNNHYTGQIVREWEDHGVLTFPAKMGLTAFVVSSFGYTIWFGIPRWIQILSGLIGAVFLFWVWTRPSKQRLIEKVTVTDNRRRFIKSIHLPEELKLFSDIWNKREQITSDTIEPLVFTPETVYYRLDLHYEGPRETTWFYQPDGRARQLTITYTDSRIPDPGTINRLIGHI